MAAARRIGIPPTDYCARMVADEKWCYVCRAWHDIEAFGSDANKSNGRASAGRQGKQRRERARYAKVRASV